MDKKITSSGLKKGQFTSISIEPMGDNDSDLSRVMLELQLKMATSSINHEYACLEYNETSCKQRQEDLLEYMSRCRAEYFEAREKLQNYDPYSLDEFEKDLMVQKLQTLGTHQPSN